MIIKLIPLVIIGFAGMFLGGTEGNISPALRISEIGSTGWIAAIAPIAFSFDGWIISTSVAYEIKNSKRNLPLALVISPLVILVLYIIYFVGISNLVGPTEIMNSGDAHLDFAANMIFGPSGAKILMLFVFISVLGTLNGLVMAMIRMPLCFRTGSDDSQSQNDDEGFTRFDFSGQFSVFCSDHCRVLVNNSLFRSEIYPVP